MRGKQLAFYIANKIRNIRDRRLHVASIDNQQCRNAQKRVLLDFFRETSVFLCVRGLVESVVVMIIDDKDLLARRFVYLAKQQLISFQLCPILSLILEDEQNHGMLLFHHIDALVVVGLVLRDTRSVGKGPSINHLRCSLCGA